MKKLWGVVALVGCVALWGGARVCADDTDHQADGTDLTHAQGQRDFSCMDFQATAAKTPSPLRKTPGPKCGVRWLTLQRHFCVLAKLPV